MSSRPGALTPVANSPTDYIVRLPSPDTPLNDGTPISTSSPAPWIPLTVGELPSLSGSSPSPSPRSGGSTVQNDPPQINIPRPEGSTNLPRSGGLTELPTVNMPVTTGQPPFVGVPTVTVPPINSIEQIASVGTVGRFVPTLLADNETGDLNWNRPDRPRPRSPNSYYRRIGCIGDGSCFFHAISKGLSEVYQLSYKEFTEITEAQLKQFESSIGGVTLFPSQLFNKPRSNDGRAVYRIRPEMVLEFRNRMEYFRRYYVSSFRSQFADLVLRDPKMHQIIRTRFSGSIELELGSLMENRTSAGNFLTQTDLQQPAFNIVVTRLAQELLSGNAVQPDFMLMLSDWIDIDIYLLRDVDLARPDPRVTPLYGGTSLHESVRGPRGSRTPGYPGQTLPDRRAIIIIGVDDFHYEIIGRVDEINTNEGIVRHVNVNFGQDEPIIEQLYRMLSNIREQ